MRPGRRGSGSKLLERKGDLGQRTARRIAALIQIVDTGCDDSQSNPGTRQEKNITQLHERERKSYDSEATGGLINLPYKKTARKRDPGSQPI